MGITYDTGALIAADRAERRIWARHRALLAQREVPTVPAPVVAQAWRGGGRQALLARLLAGCDVEAVCSPRLCAEDHAARIDGPGRSARDGSAGSRVIPGFLDRQPRRQACGL